VIIVDDMIDSAGTLYALSHKLAAAGAANIYACASHGLFTGDAVNRINNCAVTKVFVTDSLPMPSPTSDKIIQIPVAPLLARVILAEHFRTISDDKFEEDDLTNDSWSE
jgi:ribose-phosphate pyrophosphokinase